MILYFYCACLWICVHAGFFDSLLAGCIPVVFAPLSAHAQWPWHLGPLKAFAVSLYIPARRLLPLPPAKPFNVMDYLIDLYYNAHDEISMKQKAIERLAFSLQYSLPSVELPLGAFKEQREDALDIAVQHVMAMQAEYRACYNVSLDAASSVSVVDTALLGDERSRHSYRHAKGESCDRKVVYGDFVDRTQVAPLLSFAYNIHPSQI